MTFSVVSYNSDLTASVCVSQTGRYLVEALIFFITAAPCCTFELQQQQHQGIGKLVQVLEGPSDVEFLTFHPKGGTVSLAGSIADGTIWMYHTPSNSCLQVFVGHEGGVTSGTFTPDGKWVVSAGQDGTCRVWAPKTGMSKHVFRLMEHGGGEGPGAGLTCLAVGGGSDGQLALCGGEDGNGYVVHISGKKLVATVPHFEETPGNNNNTANNEMGDDNEDMEGEARSIEAVGFCPANIPGTTHWRVPRAVSMGCSKYGI